MPSSIPNDAPPPSIARPLQTGDILHFSRALLTPLQVIRYRNNEMPGKRVPQDKHGLSQ
jgi:hypothetical protein